MWRLKVRIGLWSKVVCDNGTCSLDRSELGRSGSVVRGMAKASRRAVPTRDKRVTRK